MSEVTRYSLEDQQQQQTYSAQQQQQPPQVPSHEAFDISPTPSKSVHRSKTVRNLNSAGSKMRGLFKTKNTKNKESSTSSNSSGDDNTGFLTRPILSTSASYGPTSASDNFHYQQQQQQQFAAPPPQAQLQQQQQQQPHQKQGTQIFVHIDVPLFTTLSLFISLPFFSFLSLSLFLNFRRTSWYEYHRERGQIQYFT